MTRFLRTLQKILACEKADLCKSFLDVDREFEVEQWFFNEIYVNRILLKENFERVLLKWTYRYLITFLCQEVELLIQENDQLQRKLHSQEEEFRLQNQTLMQELSTVSEPGVQSYWWTCRCSPCSRVVVEYADTLHSKRMRCFRLLLNMQEFSTVSEWGVKGYWWTCKFSQW